ncbi:hypothetical protein LPJ59_003930 [Coemansia sp. RSA 2399]|nr:hypothetical protein LPJ59_003930 [Coemansia sp. RSA 2399]KAJ1902472.1 hypothetical protein LPJ81_003596 [Coemansia sp. IMI 209127]
MSTKFHCLAILNRQGNPLYMRTFDSLDGETAAQQDQCVKYHYVAHTSCDVIEERLSQAKTSSDLFVGLLQTIGDMAVYGYVLSTGNRFVLVTSVPAESSAVRIAEIKTLFQQLHAAFVSLVCNPFYDMADDAGQIIGSPKFDGIVDELIRTYGK